MMTNFQPNGSSNILFFDTETSGLPRNYKAPASDLNNWPRMVQLAWALYDNNGNLIQKKAQIIKPNGFRISEEVARIHRVTQARAEREGIDLSEALHDFVAASKASKILVAHNISFDSMIMQAELIRSNNSFQLATMKQVCTMKSTTDFCRIPGPYGNKWPKLVELHQVLFGKGIPEAHDALVDVEAMAKCYWELIRRNVLS